MVIWASSHAESAHAAKAQIDPPKNLTKKGVCRCHSWCVEFLSQMVPYLQRLQELLTITPPTISISCRVQMEMANHGQG